MCQEILLAFTQSQSQTHDTEYRYNPQKIQLKVSPGPSRKIGLVWTSIIFAFILEKNQVRITRYLFEIMYHIACRTLEKILQNIYTPYIYNFSASAENYNFVFRKVLIPIFAMMGLVSNIYSIFIYHSVQRAHHLLGGNTVKWGQSWAVRTPRVRRRRPTGQLVRVALLSSPEIRFCPSWRVRGWTFPY